MLGANVESKTRCDDLSSIAQRAEVAGARYEGALLQVDTYFDVPERRLKLRELSFRDADGVTSASAELIGYEREDVGEPRVSRYDRREIDDAAAMKAELEAEHGVRGVVRKRRELWILGSTRIHLDSVEGVGEFVQLETVAAGAPGRAERAQYDRVFEALGLDAAMAVDVSYIDLVTGAVPAPASGGTRR